MALAGRQVTSGLIHHADRGRQYGSFAYVNRLQSVGIQISMSVPGQPTQNARAESFFKTLKGEEVYVHRYQTFEEAQAHLQTFLDDVYNAKRLHSSLEYVPPDEFEANHLKCSCMDGMGFLGALQAIYCQLCCQCRPGMAALTGRTRFSGCFASSGCGLKARPR
jgi:hypothetical protein